MLFAKSDWPGWMVLRLGRVTSWWVEDRVGRDTVTPGTVGKDTAITLPGETVFTTEPRLRKNKNIQKQDFTMLSQPEIPLSPLVESLASELVSS